jgi:hypothetical protein
MPQLGPVGRGAITKAIELIESFPYQHAQIVRRRMCVGSCKFCSVPKVVASVRGAVSVMFRPHGAAVRDLFVVRCFMHNSDASVQAPGRGLDLGVLAGCMEACLAL